MSSARPLSLIEQLENGKSVSIHEFVNQIPDLQNKLFISGFRYQQTASYKIEREKSGAIVLVEDWENGFSNNVVHKVTLSEKEVSALNEVYKRHQNAPRVQVISPRITIAEVKSLVTPSIAGMFSEGSSPKRPSSRSPSPRPPSSNFMGTVSVSLMEKSNLLGDVRKWVKDKYPAMNITVELRDSNFHFKIPPGENARANKYKIIADFETLKLDGINKLEGQGPQFEVSVSSFQKILPRTIEAKPAGLKKSQSSQTLTIGAEPPGLKKSQSSQRFNFVQPPESPSGKSKNLEPVSFNQPAESPSKKSKTPGGADEPAPSPTAMKKSRSFAGTP